MSHLPILNNCKDAV